MSQQVKIVFNSYEAKDQNPLLHNSVDAAAGTHSIKPSAEVEQHDEEYKEEAKEGFGLSLL